ncbi:MAG: DNA primase [Erysipelotrichaceae bacterium]|nr:DNA primase [Erysipelotrichaceae bacterium]
MAVIPAETIEKIRSQASITQVVGNYIPLVKKGRSFTAVCPFHDDHDPSLSISEERQIFKCFVCGVGGNAFSFVRKYRNCSFQEAVVEVAKIANVPLEVDFNRPKIISKYQKHYDLLNEVIGFTNYVIYSEKGKNAYDYLNNRGLNKEIIDYFGIGYNGSGDILHRHLKGKGYADELMIDTNVCRITDHSIKDVFTNRILFPIHDANGNPVGFSGRTLINDEAKYINTGETKIYTKGDIVYNYHRAKEDARRLNRIYLLEGVIDVIAMYRVGYYNAVCSLGTSLTQKQLELIGRLSHNLVINYDGDNAGKNATMKAGIMALKAGFNVSVINNKTGLDPDEIIKEKGEKVLKDILSREYSLIEFAFDYYNHGLDTYAKRIEYAEKVGKIIDYVKDDNDRTNYEMMLFDKTKVHRSDSHKINSNKNEKISYNKENYQDNIATNGLIKAEYTILNQMMLSKKACEDYKNKLGFFIDDNHSKIAKAIIAQYHKYGNFDYARICDELSDEALVLILSDIATRENLIKDYDGALIDDCIAIVKHKLLEKRIDEIKKILAEQNYASIDEVESLLNEMTEINRKLGGYYGQENKNNH